MNTNRLRAVERVLSNLPGTCQRCREREAMSVAELDAEIAELEIALRARGALGVIDASTNEGDVKQ